MKKLTLSIFIFLSFLTIANAQEDETKINTTPTPVRPQDTRTLRFGIVVQPMVGWINADSKNLEGQGIKFGIAGGLIMENHFNKNASLCFGLLISQGGGKVTFDSISSKVPNSSPAANVLYNYKLRYIEVPITLKLKTEEIGYVTYFGELGVAPGILWKARADVDPGSVFPEIEGGVNRDVNANREDFNTNPNNNTWIQEDNIRSFRLPLVVGAGIEYALTESTRAILGLRYNAGVLNIMRSNNTKLTTVIWL